MTDRTKADLAAENAAMRRLLAVIHDAMPPLPADPGSREYLRDAERRLQNVADMAGPEPADVYAAETWRARAAGLRELLARPLRYEPEAAGPSAAEVYAAHKGSRAKSIRPGVGM